MVWDAGLTPPGRPHFAILLCLPFQFLRLGREDGGILDSHEGFGITTAVFVLSLTGAEGHCWSLALTSLASLPLSGTFSCVLTLSKAKPEGAGVLNHITQSFNTVFLGPAGCQNPCKLTDGAVPGGRSPWPLLQGRATGEPECWLSLNAGTRSTREQRWRLLARSVKAPATQRVQVTPPAQTSQAEAKIRMVIWLF